MASKPLYRHEYKYVINSRDCEILKLRLSQFMKRDSYTNDDGTYKIRSLYFDNFDDKAFFEKRNGTDPREKFRIRIYNVSDHVIKLEKKVKIGDLTQKIQSGITKEEYNKIISGDISWMLDRKVGVIAELYARMKSEFLKPKVLVEYTRMPFVYDVGNVRVTLDTDLRSGVFSGNLFDENPLTPVQREAILEVKFDEFLPDIIKYAINPVCRERQSVSKYELCRVFG